VHFLYHLPFLHGIFIYLKILPFGERAYLPVDSFGQYSPFLGYFQKILEGKASIFYSLGKSLGGDMYGLFTYYLISPFNLVMLFLKRSTFVFNLLIVLKSASLGVTFCYFLNRRKKANFTNLIFSSMYALSTATVTYGFNIMWLDAMILLPLVVSGIDDLIKLKKTALYTITLSLTLITNYYMGFMVCLFSGIYFLYKIILEAPKGKKEIFKTILRFAVFSGLAVLIAGIVLIPSFVGLTNGRADFSWQDYDKHYNFEAQDVLSKFFTNSFELKEIANDRNATNILWSNNKLFSIIILYKQQNKIKRKNTFIYNNSNVFCKLLYQ